MLQRTVSRSFILICKAHVLADTDNIVYAMVKYAQDFTTCRKILFERYFSFDPSISASHQHADMLVNETSIDVPCGRCDNCTRGDNVSSQDITLEALTLVRVCQELAKQQQRVTFGKLLQIWQGYGLKAVNLEKLRHDETIQLPVSKKYSTFVSCLYYGFINIKRMTDMICSSCRISSVLSIILLLKDISQKTFTLVHTRLSRK